jgi:hypothetical protein
MHLQPAEQSLGRTHEIRFPQTITSQTYCSSNVGQASDAASPDLCHCVPLVRPASLETDTAACERRIAYGSPATPSFPDWRQFGLNTGEG